MELLNYEKEHLDILRNYLAECVVLLKKAADKSRAFPLEKPCEIAVYGNGVRHTSMGGTGSGEVNTRFCISIEEGLEQYGFRITTKSWLNAYDAMHRQAEKDFIREIRMRARKKRTLAVFEGMGAVMPEPEYELPLDTTGHPEAAIYVISRVCGEGNDRTYAKGDMALTDTEVRDILLLQKRYERFMLVLNVGAPVFLQPVLEVPNILLLSQLGAETGLALGRLLLGIDVPSGHLAATWPYSEADLPVKWEFGNKDDTRYTEGILVGYRNPELHGFCFGHGLGYTEFRISEKNTDITENTVTVSARIENTGTVKGKEVLQIYVRLPQGKLRQPDRVLAGFVKTRMLQPMETETVSAVFSWRELASYSVEKKRWVLEAGTYHILIGTSCDTAEEVSEYVLDKDVEFEIEKEIPKKEEIDPQIAALPDEELAYLAVGAFDPKGGLLGIVGNAGKDVPGTAGQTYRRMADPVMPPLVMADGPAGLRLAKDYVQGKKGRKAMGPAMPESTTQFLPPVVRWFLKLFEVRPGRGMEIRHQYATAIPVATAIAQSWNPDFAEQCGGIVGEEMLRFGVQLWLAPAMNIQRDPRCGRNFEYFSEDPLITGKMAAAITRGVQKYPGCGVTIKHFAANNQERNRFNNNSLVDERTLREIYLKGFGICVQEAQPKAVMTSYNLLNGIHTNERKDLIGDILRGEFGFLGIVMTDWLISAMYDKTARHPDSSPVNIAAAGGDLVMPGSREDYEKILDALKAGTLSREQVQINATRLLKMTRELQFSSRQ